VALSSPSLSPLGYSIFTLSLWDKANDARLMFNNSRAAKVMSFSCNLSYLYAQEQRIGRFTNADPTSDLLLAYQNAHHLRSIVRVISSAAELRILNSKAIV
jgi:hypothetical protein